METKDRTSHVTTGFRKILENSFVYNSWQWLTGSEKAKRNVVQKEIRPFEKAKWLDIGCGTGALLEHIDKKLNIEYVGYDLNNEYINHAKEKYGTRGRFYCTAVSQLDLIERDFDIVSAIAILHHLSDEESAQLIALAKKSLKPNAFFVIAEPVWTDKQSKLEKYLMSKDRGQNIRTESEYKKLVERDFSDVESKVISGSYNIPWSICVLRCKNN